MACLLKSGVEIEAKDGFSKEAARIAASSSKLARPLQAGQRRLAELDQRTGPLQRLDKAGQVPLPDGRGHGCGPPQDKRAAQRNEGARGAREEAHGGVPGRLFPAHAGMNRVPRADETNLRKLLKGNGAG